MIEKLTDDERTCLQFDAGVNAEKALRIIDAHAAERAALEAVIARVRAAKQWHEIDEALAGAGAPEVACAVHEHPRDPGACEDCDWARLIRERDAANARIAELEAELRHGDDVDAEMRDKLAVALTQVSDLEAQKTDLIHQLSYQRALASAASARIAELEAQHDRDVDDLARAVRNEDRALAWVAFLANAPAAPTRTECEHGNNPCSDRDPFCANSIGARQLAKERAEQAEAASPAAPKSTPESDDARRHAERDWVLRELATPTRSDHGDRHHPEIAGYDPNCEHCVFGAQEKRTDHERAVLEAMAAVPTHVLQLQVDRDMRLADAARAELALREAEK
jgi:hypothetical protein